MAIEFVFAVKGPDAAPGALPWIGDDADSTGATLLLAATNLATSTPPYDNQTGNTFVVAAQAQENSHPIYGTLWYVNSATPDVDVAHHISGDSYWIRPIFFGFSGTAAAPLDQFTGASDPDGVGVTSFATGSITPSEGGCLIVSHILFSAAVSGLTPPAGYTFSADLNFSNGSMVAYKIKGAGDTSAENPLWSWTGAVNVTGSTTSFKSDGSGGGDVIDPILSSPTGSGGTGTCSGTVSTDEGNGTLYSVVTASATSPSAAQVKLGQDHTGAAALRVVSQAVSATGVQTIASGACSAGTRYFHYMHEDAAANQSTVVSSASFTVSAGADSTNPTLPGPLNASSITTSEYDLSWSAGSDNVAVTGYERSLNGGGAWTDVGNVLTTHVSGRTPGATDNCQVRAYDAAGNRSTAITADVTLGSTAVTTAVISNGSGAPMADTLFNYSFWEGGRIGSLIGITPVEGTITSNASGVATILDLPVGAGLLELAFRATSGTSDATTDKVYYQAVTVA